MNMREGIRDTSAQDVQIDRPARWKKLKWFLPLAAAAIALALFSSVISTWLNAEASVSADRIRTAVVGISDHKGLRVFSLLGQQQSDRSDSPGIGADYKGCQQPPDEMPS